MLRTDFILQLDAEDAADSHKPWQFIQSHTNLLAWQSGTIPSTTLSPMYHSLPSPSLFLRYFCSVPISVRLSLGTHESRAARFYGCAEPSEEGLAHLEIRGCAPQGDVERGSLLATPSAYHR